MNLYVESIKQAVDIFPIVMILFTIPYIAYNYHKYGSIFSLRIIIIYSFLLYLICIYRLVILPIPSPEKAATLHGHKMQLVPFTFVEDIIKKSDIVLREPKTWLRLINNKAFLVAAFNMFMTFPFGAYLRYYFRYSATKSFVLSFLLSLFFELTQLTGLYFIFKGSYRIFDVDDLIQNTFGSMLGFFFVGFFLKVLPSREEMDKLSFRRGVQVSFLRRLFSFGFDTFFFVIMSFATAFLARAYDFNPKFWWGYIMLFVYFGIFPIFFKGSTFGMMITSTRISSVTGQKAYWYQYIIRFLSLEFIILWFPIQLNDFLISLAESGDLTESASVILHLIIYGTYAIYIFYAMLMIVLHKQLFYERLSKTQIVSTVDVSKIDNEN